MSAKQFVNPAPNMSAQKVLFFDFPCANRGEGIATKPLATGSGAYSAVGCYGNVNLRAPVSEALYGMLGSPPLEQGHPFIKEQDVAEQEDPTVAGPAAPNAGAAVYHDQIVDIDRDIIICHTGRLSGTMIPLLASKPHFSQVIVSVVEESLVVPATQSIVLINDTEWLEPVAEQKNKWFWKAGTTTNELLYTAHRRFNPRAYGLQEGKVYNLTCQWKFWRYAPQATVPATPDSNPSNNGTIQRLGISGYDNQMTFQVSEATFNI